jgi:hypothetical protein
VIEIFYLLDNYLFNLCSLLNYKNNYVLNSLKLLLVNGSMQLSPLLFLIHFVFISKLESVFILNIALI